MRLFPKALAPALALLAAAPAIRAQQGHRTGRLHYANTRAYYRGPAQLTAGVNTALYNGDLSSSPADAFFSPGLSVGVLYRLRPRLLVQSELLYVRYGAKDQLAERGLAFRADNGLLTAGFRFELLRDPSVFAYATGGEPPVQLFVQAGVGAMLYDPKTYFGTTRPNNGTVFLAPERNDYPAVAAVAPVGAGLTVRAGYRLHLTLEGNYYFTSTDYLDDVSRRGNPDHNDGFATLAVKAQYALGR